MTVTTLVDNVYDVFMPDQGLARRSGPGSTRGRLPLATMANGFVPDQLVAEHGFSLLLTLTRATGRTGCSSTAASVRTGWWRTCAGWRSIPTTWRPSC